MSLVVVKFWVCFYEPGPNFISIQDRRHRYLEHKLGFKDNVIDVTDNQTEPISTCSDRRLMSVRGSNIDWLDLRSGKSVMISVDRFTTYKTHNLFEIADNAVLLQSADIVHQFHLSEAKIK